MVVTYGRFHCNWNRVIRYKNIVKILTQRLFQLMETGACGEIGAIAQSSVARDWCAGHVCVITQPQRRVADRVQARLLSKSSVT